MPLFLRLYSIQISCSREEFSQLADLGILCQPDEYAFPTTVSVGEGKNTPSFSDETAHILAGKKELLFFENWQTSNYKQDTYLHLAEKFD